MWFIVSFMCLINFTAKQNENRKNNVETVRNCTEITQIGILEESPILGVIPWPKSGGTD